MYVFSNQKPELLTEEAFQEYLWLVEEFFKTTNDRNQINIHDLSLREEREIFLYTLNLIFYNGKVIGATDILPCTKTHMRKFLDYKISEPELLSEVKEEFINKKLDYKRCDAIYLVSAFIKPEHRRQGLVLESFVDSITRLNITKPSLFYWAYTKEGRKLSEKIADKLKLELFARTDNDKR